MRTVIFAAIAAMSAIAPAYAADTAMGAPLTTQQCTDELTKCGADDKCKQDLQTKHPECSSATSTKSGN